jgi:REP element-mobilizing transposase RayT
MEKYMISVIDYLQDTIFEQAFERKLLRLKISEFDEQIASNLIKIAIFGQESTWKKEAISYFNRISRMKLKQKCNRLSKKQYFEQLFKQPFEPKEPWDESFIYSLIREIVDEQKYEDLKHIEINKQNINLVYDKIETLLDNICQKLSENPPPLKEIDKLLIDYVRFWTKK